LFPGRCPFVALWPPQSPAKAGKPRHKDTPVGKIVHTGDFKIDPTPFYGKMIDLDAFAKAGNEGVLLLLSDSTNVEHLEHSLSERVIYDKFEEIFAAAQGLTIVSMFASNVGRMGQVF
jgi:ribonuclease J